MTSSLLSGFLLGGSLILAIGAQNAFVLKQGLLRQHVFAICLTCAVSDAVLITAGIAGMGAALTAAPGLSLILQFGGAAFLASYGALSLWRAFGDDEALVAAGAGQGGLRPALIAVLGFTWLNPHVYLDTVVLVGSVASQAESATWFGVGAVMASFAFFFSLGYGARLLAPLFARPLAWRVLHLLIGAVMIALAVKLVLM